MRLDAAPGADSPLIGLRDRKKSETRSALREAALRLFKEQGFGGTSVDEIAAAANVSRSTFFRYFGSKEAVLFAQTDEMGELLVQLLEARPSDEGPIRAFERALLELTVAIDGDSTRSSSRMLEELMQDDPFLRARRSHQMERFTDAIAASFAFRRSGRHEPTTVDMFAAATCIAVTQQIGSEWREAEGLSSVDAIKKGFSLLRELVD